MKTFWASFVPCRSGCAIVIATAIAATGAVIATAANGRCGRRTPCMQVQVQGAISASELLFVSVGPSDSQLHRIMVASAAASHTTRVDATTTCWRSCHTGSRSAAAGSTAVCRSRRHVPCMRGSRPDTQ
jgi:hypothetical protein